MKTWFQKDTNQTYGKNYPYVINWPTNETGWSELMKTEPVIHAPNGTDYPASVLTNWFETEYAEQFEILRVACQRPKARIEDNYREAWFGPIPNFVNLRQVAQILSARAEAYLKKGRPDLALQDLTMVRRLMDCLHSSPTLVSTMIRVAIGGLYVSSIRESLTNGDWTDAQLQMIQQQLQSMDFLPELDRSLRAEVAAVDSFAEGKSTKEIAALWRWSSGSGSTKNFWEELGESLGEQSYMLIPRGWVYQNMVVYTHTMANHCWTDCDLGRNRIFPAISSNNAVAIDKMVVARGRLVISRPSPYPTS